MKILIALLTACLLLTSCSSDSSDQPFDSLAQDDVKQVILSKGPPKALSYTLSEEESEGFVEKLDDLKLVKTDEHEFTSEYIRTGHSPTTVMIDLDDGERVTLEEIGYWNLFIDSEAREEGSADYPTIFTVEDKEAVDEFWEYINEITGWELAYDTLTEFEAGQFE